MLFLLEIQGSQLLVNQRGGGNAYVTFSGTLHRSQLSKILLFAEFSGLNCCKISMSANYFEKKILKEDLCAKKLCALKPTTGLQWWAPPM